MPAWAIVVAGVAGCSSDTSSAGSSGTKVAKVAIDGQDQNVKGTVSCVSNGGNVNIAIGDGATGVGAVISDANPPVVHSVGLGNVNGVTLGYSDASPSQSNVQATKNGNSYTIKGTATGIDMANPMQPLNKPFEVDVTCP